VIASGSYGSKVYARQIEKLPFWTMSLSSGGLPAYCRPRRPSGRTAAVAEKQKSAHRPLLPLVIWFDYGCC